MNISHFQISNQTPAASQDKTTNSNNPNNQNIISCTEKKSLLPLCWTLSGLWWPHPKAHFEFTFIITFITFIYGFFPRLYFYLTGYHREKYFIFHHFIQNSIITHCPLKHKHFCDFSLIWMIERDICLKSVPFTKIGKLKIRTRAVMDGGSCVCASWE